MKLITGAVLILAAAVLFGAAMITEAIRPNHEYAFGCAAAGGGAFLVLLGMACMLAGLKEIPTKPKWLPTREITQTPTRE
jgi:predicted phage tail protein